MYRWKVEKTSSILSLALAQAVDGAVRSFGINRNSFCLLFYDSAKYMVAERTILKSDPKLFHVTRVAHLLHNCAMKVLQAKHLVITQEKTMG